ncbi:MAG: HDIG domain-containing protein, partial [Bacteroides sp.]|nr:HDIG domain-containing protein [Bacteroides sp.]
DLLYKILLYLSTVAVIVYFLPREGKFNYSFEANRPWKYGLLTATFDFPIYKDDASIKKEQDSILATFQPFYQLEESVEKLNINLLRNYYTNHPEIREIVPVDYIPHVANLLRDIYKAGVVSTDEIHELHQDSTYSILVINNKVANIRIVNGIYTPKEAYEYILNYDPDNYRVEFLQQLHLNDYIKPNLIFDQVRTQTAREELFDNYSWASGLVQSGQKIIDRGEIVDQNTYNILESLRKESIQRSDSKEEQRMTLLGQILFVGFMIACFMLYLELFRKDYYQRKGNLLLLFIIVVFYAVLTALLVSNNIYTAYIIPYAMLPIIIRIFLDSRTAFMTHVVTILICSVVLASPHEFILLQIGTGMIAIFSLRELSQRSQLFKTALLIFLSYSLINFSFELINGSSFAMLNLNIYIYFLLNGALLLFAYPLLFLLEKTFGFTSNVTLVELSNINNNLLRRMSEIAPGTFQHSLQVANLAAEAALRIGAKSQLVRTGALYHDIGKMENPVFFTENQSGVNPHKALTNEQSAQIIISHVTDGVKLAEKHNLPKVIKEFITSHHGIGITKYFYIMDKNEYPDEEIDIEKFSYPGPNPSTKEMAILMMADAVEAASRSLQEYTEETISNLVDKIVDSQVAEGFFKNCPITFKDIAEVKDVFKERLKIIHHTRISYPELKNKM